jgi:ABC-type phosphate transport system substrate-binding protein
VEEKAVTRHPSYRWFPRRLAMSRLAAIGAAIAVAGLSLSPTAAIAGRTAGAAGYATINGSGSSWSEVALDQWSQDMNTRGLTVNFNPDGSAEGRQDYIQGQDDFAASDPPFRDGHDRLAGTGSEIPFAYGYSYVPDTAGGTAFMYHLDVAGKQITNLRLKPDTIMKIFTGQITNWNNPEITKDYGAQLPSIPITPVVRSDGSGATFFFTRWMSHLFPSEWDAFCSKVTNGRVSSGCGQTEFYPTSGWGNVKAENGSNNVASYITASYANGAIGYDEYAYALNSHYPVVKVLNPAGYYVLPSASNVAVALTQAHIDEVPTDVDFLQQNLDDVYTFKDPRSYPLSSYSYLIVPKIGTKAPSAFNNAKGKSLSTFIDFFLCGGQKEVAKLGYSPLPLNLVKGGLKQADRIPGHITGPNVNTLQGCPNPTFTNGQLTILKNAPYPSKCDKLGAPLNCGSGGGGSSSPSPTSSSTTSTGTTPGGGSTAGTPGGSGPGGSSGSDPGGTAGPVAGQVVNVGSDSASRAPLGVLTALAIVIAIIAPPALGIWLRRRRVGASR